MIGATISRIHIIRIYKLTRRDVVITYQVSGIMTWNPGGVASREKGENK